jgi:hypothetical protein
VIRAEPAGGETTGRKQLSGKLSGIPVPKVRRPAVVASNKNKKTSSPDMALSPCRSGCIPAHERLPIQSERRQLQSSRLQGLLATVAKNLRINKLRVEQSWMYLYKRSVVDLCRFSIPVTAGAMLGSFGNAVQIGSIGSTTRLSLGILELISAA